ncbi:DNA adenine methylase [Chryseobacterium sp. JV274]|uniref:DNA adenine methylase n=1 Tax=Chryseobacterium sp. JV274 TaxID=1932669 RepID=UPI000986D4C9|nr:Dam family site-specific DNA-(adenine-N6)-methyltransferase [Chryseobacterium sp. JV274]
MTAKPFVKWAGGKRKLLKEISSLFSDNIKTKKVTYIEPFVGGGSVLFWLLSCNQKISKIIINDINSDLMNVYRVIADQPEELISVLEIFQLEYHAFRDNPEGRKNYYYTKRSSFNLRDQQQIIHAAIFVFLNRTCFNGLYRVNKKNEFNVPIGSYKTPLICDKDNIIAVSKLLKNVIILNGDYYETLKYIDQHENCFFYLDPPYKPLSKTANFNKYSNYIFDDSEQQRLKEFCSLLNEKRISWVLSNSDLKNENQENCFFDDLYKDYNINRVNVNRVINNNSKEKNIKELLITNRLDNKKSLILQN